MSDNGKTAGEITKVVVEVHEPGISEPRMVSVEVGKPVYFIGCREYMRIVEIVNEP